MAKQWEVQLTDKTLGPLSNQQLHQLVSSGRLDANTPVRVHGSSVWSTAASVPGLLKQSTTVKDAPQIADSEDWYVGRNGQQEGPFSCGQMKSDISTGRLHSSDLVWKKGMPDWLPAHQVLELAAEFDIARRRGGVAGPKSRTATQKGLAKLIPWTSTVILLLIVAWLVMKRPTDQHANQVAVEDQKAADLQRKADDTAENLPRVIPGPLLADEDLDRPLPEAPAMVAENGLPKAEPPERPALPPGFKTADLNMILRGRPADDLKPPVVAAQPDGWEVFRHPKGPISAEMPTPVTLNKSGSVLPSQPGTVRIQLSSPPGVNVEPPSTYTGQVGKVSCSLQVSTLPAFVSRQLSSDSRQFEQFARKYLEEMRDVLAEEFGGKIVRDVPLRWTGIRGRDVKLENEVHVAVITLVFTHSQMFQASLVFPKEEELTEESQRFFGSLILSLPGKKPIQIGTAQSSEVADGGPAEPIPPKNDGAMPPLGDMPTKIREFLERSEAWKQSLIEEKKSQIEKLELSIANLAPQITASSRRDLALAKATLNAIMKNNRPAAELPYPAEAGDIGFAGVLSQVFFLDDTTLEASLRIKADTHRIVVTNIKRAAIESQVKRVGSSETEKVWAYNGLLRVLPEDVGLSLKEEHARLRRAIAGHGDFIFCEPVHKNEVEAFRDSFIETPQPDKAD